MAEQRKFQAIKGVRDILPPESALWNRVEETAREVFATYGYGEIRLPIFEQTDLFARSIGAETDVVAKEMYTFEDRPEGLEMPRAVGDYGRFIETVAALLDNGVIPRKAGNQLAIEEMKLAWDKFQHRAADDKEYEVLENLHQMILHKESLQLGPELSLRPEATASVCRAYIEHGMHTWPGNVKLYYIGPMFRRERPQKGRYRQFYQIGAEVLGQSDAPAIDAEVIEMLMHFFAKVGLSGECSGALQGGTDAGLKAGGTGCTLYINSIGCKDPDGSGRGCRPAYVAKLKEALIEHINELKADSQRRVETNPLRVLDSKLPEEQAVIEKLPRITDNLCEACREHYAEVKKQLTMRGVAYQENWRLVRGLDYYMRTTFEITAPGLGSQNAVCGGGRYDGLVELLGGQPTKGIGFAIGTDRLILSLQERDKKLKAEVREDVTVHVTGVPLKAEVGKVKVEVGVDVFVAWMGAAAQPVAVKMARKLREAGISVEVPAEELKFKKSIGLADKLGARFALIIGENEIAEGKYALKRLADGVQEKVGAEELVEKVKKN